MRRFYVLITLGSQRVTFQELARSNSVVLRAIHLRATESQVLPSQTARDYGSSPPQFLFAQYDLKRECSSLATCNYYSQFAQNYSTSKYVKSKGYLLHFLRHIFNNIVQSLCFVVRSKLPSNEAEGQHGLLITSVQFVHGRNTGVSGRFFLQNVNAKKHYKCTYNNATNL